MAAILILGEDVAHGALVGELVRQTLAAHADGHGADWFTAHLDAMFLWLGPEDLSPVRPGLRYAKSDAVAGPRLRGGFRGATPGFQYWRRVLSGALEEGAAEGFVVATDTDGQPDTDLTDAIRALQDGRPIIAAIAHPEAEAWFVLGFEVANTQDRLRHEAVVATLGFDPVKLPHRLTAHPNHADTGSSPAYSQARILQPPSA